MYGKSGALRLASFAIKIESTRTENGAGVAGLGLEKVNKEYTRTEWDLRQRWLSTDSQGAKAGP